MIRGRFHAKSFRFPYQDDAFDFAIVTSVFTHLLCSEAEHCLDEIRSVSAPGAPLATFFFLNEDSTKLIANGKSTLTFADIVEGTAVEDAEFPEGAVAFPEIQVLEMLGVRGFVPTRTVHYGNWRGRREGLSYQDIIVAQRS